MADDDWMIAWAVNAHYRFGESSLYVRPVDADPPPKTSSARLRELQALTFWPDTGDKTLRRAQDGPGMLHDPRAPLGTMWVLEHDYDLDDT